MYLICFEKHSTSLHTEKAAFNSTDDFLFKIPALNP